MTLQTAAHILTSAQAAVLRRQEVEIRDPCSLGEISFPQIVWRNTGREPFGSFFWGQKDTNHFEPKGGKTLLGCAFSAACSKGSKMASPRPTSAMNAANRLVSVNGELHPSATVARGRLGKQQSTWLGLLGALSRMVQYTVDPLTCQQCTQWLSHLASQSTTNCEKHKRPSLPGNSTYHGPPVASLRQQCLQKLNRQGAL